jgi:hypothetical protein
MSIKSTNQPYPQNLTPLAARTYVVDFRTTGGTATTCRTVSKPQAIPLRSLPSLPSHVSPRLSFNSEYSPFTEHNSAYYHLHSALSRPSSNLSLSKSYHTTPSDTSSYYPRLHVDANEPNLVPWSVVEATDSGRVWIGSHVTLSRFDHNRMGYNECQEGRLVAMRKGREEGKVRFLFRERDTRKEKWVSLPDDMVMYPRYYQILQHTQGLLCVCS